MALIQCPECKSEVSNQASNCRMCGYPFTKNNQTTKNRSTAIFFALLLGGVGGHKFYLNQPVSGVLYILFSLTFIPLILSIVEAVQYLSMSDEVFLQKLSEGKLSYIGK